MSADLRKLSNVVDKNIVKKTVYDKLVIKTNDIDTKIPSKSELVTEKQHNSDKQSLETKIKDVDKKVPNTSGLLKKTDYNTEITEIPSSI